MKSKKVKFTTTLLRFSTHGEKTGWTYIDIPADIAQTLKPGNRRSFRVKGTINQHPIKMIAVMPMGNGNFILSVNAEMRKAIGKKHGAMVDVELSVDTSEFKIDSDLMECLNDDPEALAYFNTLAPSHRNYFSKWIESAKTEVTKAKRIALTLKALSKHMNYGEMLRESKKL
ncbi:MAG TPA: YdeI/OmpD-associated family protein [Bacteroidia bacterium]|nr:YdeI/OmpD-associated family protein [Bacteroidia bacterium]